MGILVQPESKLMRLAKELGLESIAWSLRRLYCPVDRKALVLEVGSGGRPYFRSNVLLDAYENTRQRHWDTLVSDRPTVLGFVENLPFKDKTFDFVIASHVLEHSSDPERFLLELQRVAKAGYIESPDAFMERINPYKDHRSEITMRNNRLLIRKKKASICDKELVELYEQFAKPAVAGRLIPAQPFLFHIRYYWQGTIDFVVINPEQDAGWPAPENEDKEASALSFRSHVSGFMLKLIRTTLSQGTRNNKIDLADLMRCPNCSSITMAWQEHDMVCPKCHQRYPAQNGILNMLTPQLKTEGPK